MRNHRTVFPILGLIFAVLLVSCVSGSESVPTNVVDDIQRSGALIASATPLSPTEVTTTEIRINPNYHDSYLVNPGIGWQDGPEPYGFMNFPDTVTYANRREIAWSELNPARGVYHWDLLNTQLSDAVEMGKQFSFRVYTHVGERYDGNKIPNWVVDEGARFIPSSEPDYSNCVYQEAWGDFVNELVSVYDGNPDIAFIDISGYGNFNEWSWQDSQTEWDEQWRLNYASGTPSGDSFISIDGQARRRLVDIFIGGAFEGHTCRMPDGTISHVDYSYPGFQKTQLVMPYAGIVQSSQYVISRRNDIGFRYDCLGRDGMHVFEKIGDVILRTWENAPVVYELCKPAATDIEDAIWLLQATHGSIVHNNQWGYSKEELERMMLPVGYRYYLKEIIFQMTGRSIEMEMEWQNVGLAPSYPKMGQDFRLYFCLIDASGRIVYKDPVQADVSTWLPSATAENEPASNQIEYRTRLPSSVMSGSYQVGVVIDNLRTDQPIQLAINGRDENGVYILFETEIK